MNVPSIFCKQAKIKMIKVQITTKQLFTEMIILRNSKSYYFVIKLND